MKFKTVLVSTLLLFPVVAGGLVWASWDALTDLKVRALSGNEVCSTLDERERTELLGAETPVRMLEVEGTLDAYTCRWATKDTTTPAWVQAVSAPADKWALEIKGSMGSLPMGGDPARVRALRAAAAKPVSSGADGCRLARRTFELGGAPDGAERLVSATQSSQGMPLMMAQSCVDGRYYAVLVTSPTLQLDSSLQRKTDQALSIVEAQLG